MCGVFLAAVCHNSRSHLHQRLCGNQAERGLHKDQCGKQRWDNNTMNFFYPIILGSADDCTDNDHCFAAGDRRAQSNIYWDAKKQTVLDPGKPFHEEHSKDFIIKDLI